MLDVHNKKNKLPYRLQFCRLKVTKFLKISFFLTDETLQPTKIFNRQIWFTEEIFHQNLIF